MPCQKQKKYEGKNKIWPKMTRENPSIKILKCLAFQKITAHKSQVYHWAWARGTAIGRQGHGCLRWPCWLKWQNAGDLALLFLCKCLLGNSEVEMEVWWLELLKSKHLEVEPRWRTPKPDGLRFQFDQQFLELQLHNIAFQRNVKSNWEKNRSKTD